MPFTAENTQPHAETKWNFQMAQGGDIHRGDGYGGESIYGQFFRDERFLYKHSKRGRRARQDAKTRELSFPFSSKRSRVESSDLVLETLGVDQDCSPWPSAAGTIQTTVNSSSLSRLVRGSTDSTWCSGSWKLEKKLWPPLKRQVPKAGGAVAPSRSLTGQSTYTYQVLQTVVSDIQPSFGTTR